MKNTTLAALALALAPTLHAQIDSVWKEAPEVEISGGLDLFYLYDFSQPSDDYRYNFLCSYNRHNEFNLNLGYAKLAIKHTKYRSNFALQAGTYAQDNYDSEPEALRLISEANVGFALNKKNTLWLDAGIMPSHIGFESAFANQNMTMTRSLLAENSPYYSAGAKLSYAPNTKWDISLLILNGWQRITRQPDNTLPALGTQLKYSPSDKLSLNWSTFFGSAYPDSRRRYRFFNNLYALWKVSDYASLVVGFDIGAEQEDYRSQSYYTWFSPVAIAQFKLHDNWKLAIRGEYYTDPHLVVINAWSRTGFSVASASINVDYCPNDIFMARLEARGMSAQETLFEGQKTNFTLGGSLVTYFSRSLTKS